MRIKSKNQLSSIAIISRAKFTLVFSLAWLKLYVNFNVKNLSLFPVSKKEEMIFYKKVETDSYL